jgi:Tol biopolymer transport system component
VQWLKRDGHREALLSQSGSYVGDPRLSPDGTRVALTIRDGANQDIWVYASQRAAMTRLTFGGVAYLNPVWSRDGRYLVFGSIGSGMFWTRADGSGQPRSLVAATNGVQFPDSIAPDGRRLVFQQVDGRPQLWTAELQQDDSGITSDTPIPFLKSSFTDQDARISPDGRWLAYSSNESGIFEVLHRQRRHLPACQATRMGHRR